MSQKTTCPVSKTTFLAKAKTVEVVLDGSKLLAGAREFSTGSLGWNISTKVTVLVDGVPCTAQVGLNLTLVGSKPGERPQD